MKISFRSAMILWRGPAPFYFLPVPDTQSKKIKTVANQLSYGWGVLPVIAKIGKTEFATSLMPKDGVYLLPVRNQVRFAEKLELGVEISVRVSLGG